ncbi:hypothetical protein [Curtobacterium flaccumfaciens]|uniref:hypothetical protein n=1 Tax=Curtobacterium flaccumfaciens TaxID=2035 RepID=UPI001E3FF3BA|nr:hypothetical protein [Curtobacterium allii]MCE0459126.1 hypothetical protein [Curtobacterium allii]
MAVTALVVSILALMVAAVGVPIAISQAKSAKTQAGEAEKQTKTAEDAARSAEEQARSAEAQLSEMQRQTAATLASLEPQLEFVVVKTVRDLIGNDQRLATRKLHAWEWQVINHGGAAALDVEVSPNFDPDSTDHGEMLLGGIAAGESRTLWSRYQHRMPTYPEAVEKLGGGVPSLAVTFDTIQGEHVVAALDVIIRNEVDR